MVLRGGTSGVNYHSEAVETTVAKLKLLGLNSKVMVDFSHGNSQKNFRNQSKACEDVAKQIESGSTNILGVMIESNIMEGSQTLTSESKQQVPTGLIFSIINNCTRVKVVNYASLHIDQKAHCCVVFCTAVRRLKWGVSITDQCVGAEETVRMLQRLACAVERRRPKDPLN